MNLFKPSYRLQELSAADYYRKQLHWNDQELLKPFVSSLGKELEIRTYILAVGSSTFPKTHWENNAKIKQQYGEQASFLYTTYADIDFLVIPEKITSQKQQTQALEDYVQKKEILYVHYPKTLVRKGIEYQGKGKHKTIHPSFDVENTPCFSIQLRNRHNKNYYQDIDIIYARPAELHLTAEQKIEQERAKNRPFSLLYP